MTERITPGMLRGTLLNNINSDLVALNRSSNELSSGKKILEASDNPSGAGQVIDLQSQLDALSSYTSNIQDGISWQNVASGAMASMSNILQRVRELVVEASNGTNGPGALKSIAGAVEQLTDAIKQEANTQYGGQYVFAGTATTTPPYEQGENDEYAGNEGTVARAIAPGMSVTVSTNIESLLGNGKEAGDGKLLDVLRTISEALNSGSPEAINQLSSTDLNNLDANMEVLLGLQTVSGSTTNELQTAATHVESLQASITQALTNVDGPDVVATTIAYSNEQAAYEAALRAGAQIVQESLLNFLQ